MNTTTTAADRQCRHCHERHVSKPRGLCFRCYYTPGIRDRYPSESRFVRPGVRDWYYRAPLPVEPTDAVPGSAEKVEVLAKRVDERVQLWHPGDAETRD